MKNKIALLLSILSVVVMHAQDFTFLGVDYDIINGTENVEIVGGCVKELDIPNTVLNNATFYTVVGVKDGAFSGCLTLEEVRLSSNVIDIGKSAFYSCTNLINVDIIDLTTSRDINIGDNAFASCTSLINLDLYYVSSLGESAFTDCTSLVTINIPFSLTSIGDSAFSSCTNLEDININNLTTSRDISIGDNAFASCTSLINLDLYYVSSLGESAFTGCTSLVTINIPFSLISIGDSAFSSCTNLEDININNLTISRDISIGNNAFASCTSLINIDLYYVSSLGESAFTGCTSLVTINIPFSLTSIGDSAFSSCTNLENINIINLATSRDINIGNNAFASCISLINLDLYYVTIIGENAFEGCISLKTLPLFSSIETIKDYAFAYCTGLETVNSSIEFPLPIHESVFSGLTLSNITLNVPEDSYSEYKMANVWKEFSPFANPLRTVNNELDSKISLYPNPVKDLLYLNLKSGIELNQVIIYNNLGQRLQVNRTKNINVSNLVKGGYFVEIVTNVGKSIKKIVVE